MASTLERHITTTLHTRISRGITNDLTPTSALSLTDFTSNDYLALSKSSELKQAFLEKLQTTPDILGAGGSRLLNNNTLHEDLEERLQDFFNEGKGELEAIIFNSGQDANVGFFSCIPQKGDFIVYDIHIHASIHDGMRASKARSFHFAHNSAQDLQKVLARLRDGQPELVSGGASLFIALESIYSMDGSVVPLLQIVEMLDSMFPAKNAYILVDEAHSTGIYGPQGRGLVSTLGLQDRIFARLHTFSKALSAAGGKHPPPHTRGTPTYGVITA
jgi:8-amino-7-oxononanoate synthase